MKEEIDPRKKSFAKSSLRFNVSNKILVKSPQKLRVDDMMN